MTYNELLNKGIQIIENHQLEATSARILLQHCSGLDYTELFMKIHDEVDETVSHVFLMAINKYVKDGIPVQYITNEQYFYGRKFYVDESVLIPRWETEELVQIVLEYQKEKNNAKKIEVLDIGCGSGCIAITLALEIDNSHVYAIDISEKAIDITQKNSEINQAKVMSFQSDLFSNVSNKFDLIISNPPYVKSNDDIGYAVDKEPSIALNGGIDGLDIYRRILKDVKPYLKKEFLLAFEHGYDQSLDIKMLALMYLKEVTVTSYKDSSGKERFTLIEGK